VFISAMTFPQPIPEQYVSHCKLAAPPYSIAGLSGERG